MLFKFTIKVAFECYFKFIDVTYEFGSYKKMIGHFVKIIIFSLFLYLEIEHYSYIWFFTLVILCTLIISIIYGRVIFIRFDFLHIADRILSWNCWNAYERHLQQLLLLHPLVISWLVAAFPPITYCHLTFYSYFYTTYKKTSPY